MSALQRPPRPPVGFDRAALALERASERLARLTAAFWWLIIKTRVLLTPVVDALGRRWEALKRMDDVTVLLAAQEDAVKSPSWFAEAAGTSTPSVGPRRRHRSCPTPPADPAAARDRPEPARDGARALPLDEHREAHRL